MFYFQVARLAAQYNVKIERIKEGRYIVDGKINIFVRVSNNVKMKLMVLGSTIFTKSKFRVFFLLSTIYWKRFVGNFLCIAGVITQVTKLTKLKFWQEQTLRLVKLWHLTPNASEGYNVTCDFSPQKSMLWDEHCQSF